MKIHTGIWRYKLHYILTQLENCPSIKWYSMFYTSVKKKKINYCSLFFLKEIWFKSWRKRPAHVLLSLSVRLCLYDCLYYFFFNLFFRPLLIIFDTSKLSSLFLPSHFSVSSIMIRIKCCIMTIKHTSAYIPCSV